jgi:hypothetical protein
VKFVVTLSKVGKMAKFLDSDCFVVSHDLFNNALYNGKKK